MNRNRACHVVSLLMALMVTVGGWYGVAAGEEVKEDQSIHRARELILAGHYQEADQMLAGLSGDEVEIDSLRGLIDLQLERYHQAAERFMRVLELRPTRLAVWLYLGQAKFALGDWDGAVDALHRGQEVGVGLPGYFSILARALTELGREGEAYTVLAQGLENFSDEKDLLRERTLLLIRMGLFTAAMEAGRNYLEAEADDPYGIAMLAEALRNAGQLEEATEVLEEGRLRFPQVPDLAVSLAYTYSLRGMHRSSARLFQSLVLRDGRYAFEAADQYRIGERYRDALRLNGAVHKPERQLPQRLVILVGAERFDAAIGVLAAAQAQGCDLDDKSLYLLAYAALRSGHPLLALELAEQIGDGPHKRLTPSILDAAKTCTTSPWRCP